MMRYVHSTIAILAIAIAIGACGSTARSKTSTGPSVQKLQSAATASTAKSEARALAHLPQPQAGVVNIADGETLGITGDVDKAYSKSNPGVTVNLTAESSAQAFGSLCSGKSDIALVTQQPTASELAQCTENGLSFKDNSQGNPEEITLAADAIVVATKNEANVGGDCLRRQTVRDIFEPGSTMVNWSQIGFDDIPLTTAGRAPQYSVGTGLQPEIGTYALFSNLVLGVEGDATLSDVRSNYDAYASDEDVLNKVTGSTALDAILRAKARQRSLDLRIASGSIKASEAAAAAAANAAELAKIRAANAKLAKTKKVLTPAQSAAIDSANAAADAAVQKEAEVRAYDRAVAKINAHVNTQFAASIKRAENPGVLGVFRYTYYTLYENRLRPMEIWDPVASTVELQDEGIATTDSRAGDKITVSERQQAGGGVSQVETVSVPPTPTTPGDKYTSDSNQTLVVPAGGPVNVNQTPNCIFPSAQTITSGVYPLSVQLMAYVPKRELERPAVISYLSYYLGAGQQTVDLERLVPIDDTTREDEYKFVTGKNLPASLLQDGASPASGQAASNGTTSNGTTGNGTTGDSSQANVSSTPGVNVTTPAATTDTTSGVSTLGGIG